MVYLAVFTSLFSAGSLAVSLLIWWSARRRTAHLESSLRSLGEELGRVRKGLEGRLETLQRESERTRLTPIPSPPVTVPVVAAERFATSVVAAGAEAPGLGGGMNLSRRVQILRLEKRGQSPAQIAASLGVPQPEVELVLKISRLTQETR